MVAKASNRTAFVQLKQASWDCLHGHDHDFTALGCNAGQLAFPCLADVQNQWLTLRCGLLEPFIELMGADLLHGDCLEVGGARLLQFI